MDENPHHFHNSNLFSPRLNFLPWIPPTNYLDQEPLNTTQNPMYSTHLKGIFQLVLTPKSELLTRVPKA